MEQKTPGSSSTHANHIHSAPEVEKVVLGAIMLDRDALYRVIELLTTESFSTSQYRKVWDVCTHLAAQDQPIDFHTVSIELERRGQLTICGGLAGIVSIFESVFTSANIRNHAERLVDYQKRRALATLITDASSRLHDDPQDTVARLEGRLTEIAEIGRGQLQTTDEQINQMIADDLEMISGRIQGCNWPMVELTQATRGIRPGKIHLIVALFKSGKSKFTIATIEQLIVKDQAPVLFLSLEMGSTQVFHWLAGCALKVNTSFYGSPRLSRRQMEQTHEWVAQNIGSGRLIVDARAYQTPESICVAMRRAVATKGVKVVFIDYLQKIIWSDKQQHVSDIVRGMNLIAATAKRLNVPIVALSQVPKSVEKAARGELITLGDVKDAAVFAELADVGICITDPNRHKPTDSPERYYKFLVEQRDGATKLLDVQADMRFGQFMALTKVTADQLHNANVDEVEMEEKIAC